MSAIGLRSAIASSSFNPLDLSPLILLDADNPAGNGTIPADSSSLATWVDLSGNGNTFSGGTSPTYLRNQMAGHNVVSFNGTSQHLIASSSGGNAYTAGSPISFFAISTFDNNGGNAGMLLVNGFFPLGGFAMGGASANEFDMTTFGITQINSTNDWSASVFALNSTIFNGTTGLGFYKNGASLDSQTITAPTSANENYYLGRYSTAALQFWNGKANFIFIKYGTLTAAQLAQMHGWGKARLGI